MGRVMLVLFAVLMVFGSAIHTLWTAKGIALKYCYGSAEIGRSGAAPLQRETSDEAACRGVVQATNDYWDLAYNIGAVPGYIGAVLLIGLVLWGKTWYPRWTVLANPAALILLEPLADRAPAPIGAVLSGGFTNLSIAVFFVVSVATSWTREDDKSSGE